MPFAPHGAATVEGSHAHQCGDLTTVKGAQLGQVGQQREGELLTHAGNGAQEVVLLPPHRTLPEHLSQALVKVVFRVESQEVV